MDMIVPEDTEDDVGDFEYLFTTLMIHDAS